MAGASVAIIPKKGEDPARTEGYRLVQAMTRSSKAFCGVVREGYTAHLDSMLRGCQHGGRAGRGT
eukprot:5357038-Lingulodinium_polyedra.AAC.1